MYGKKILLKWWLASVLMSGLEAFPQIYSSWHGFRLSSVQIKCLKWIASLDCASRRKRNTGNTLWENTPRQQCTVRRRNPGDESPQVCVNCDDTHTPQNTCVSTPLPTRNTLVMVLKTESIRECELVMNHINISVLRQPADIQYANHFLKQTPL